MPHPDPKKDPKKSDGELHFSDLTSSAPQKPPTAADVTSFQDDNALTSSDTAVAPPPPSHAPAISTPPIEPGHSEPTRLDVPVFRNPAGASHAADLLELGAAPPTPQSSADLLQESSQPAPRIRLNLSPSFDTFSAHGLQVERDQAKATTLFGKIALALHLNTIFSRKNLRYAGVGLVSFAVFLLVFNFQTIVTQITFRLNPPKPTAPVVTPTASPVAVANQAEPIDSPDVIIIPKLNINAPVIFEPSISEQAIQNSLQRGVVHYAGTALPGEPSNAVIVGHSSNDWWQPGNYKFVFALLDKLAPGDQIQINYQKRKYVYQVSGSKIVEPSEISVLQPTSEPILTLITCTPPGTSWKRLVVTANQIQPAPVKPEQKAEVAVTNQASQSALPGNAPSFFDQIKRWFGFSSTSDKKPTQPTTSPSAEPKRNYLPEPA